MPMSPNNFLVGTDDNASTLNNDMASFYQHNPIINDTYVPNEAQNMLVVNKNNRKRQQSNLWRQSGRFHRESRRINDDDSDNDEDDYENDGDYEFARSDRGS
jgi:hypothetical protein